MNLFQFVADMLHLMSFVLIINQIHKSKSVQGELIRVVLPHAGDVPGGLHDAIHGPVPVLHLAVQHGLQDPLHRGDLLHHLPDPRQEALLPGLRPEDRLAQPLPVHLPGSAARHGGLPPLQSQGVPLLRVPLELLGLARGRRDHPAALHRIPQARGKLTRSRSSPARTWPVWAATRSST